MENEFGITREMILEIVKATSIAMKRLKRYQIDEYSITMSNKNLSELLSKTFEGAAAKIFSKRLGYKIEKEKVDRDPDLTFTKINRPLEVKVTSTDYAWTGGEFSQRAPDYLLVSWGGDFDEFYITLVRIDHDDWQSRMAQRFYGPSFTIRKLFEKDRIEFMGKLEMGIKGRIEMRREKIHIDEKEILIE